MMVSNYVRVIAAPDRVRGQRVGPAVLFLFAALFLGRSAFGQHPADTPLVVDFTIHPAAQPQPTLKYRLYPTLSEQTDDDPIPIYRKAFQTLHLTAVDQDVLQRLLEEPETQFSSEEAEKFLENWRKGLDQVERAARCERCDWHIQLRGNWVEGVKVIPWNQLKTVTRLVCLEARLRLLSGRIDEALQKLHIGFGIAYQLRQNQVTVQGLIEIGDIQALLEQVTVLEQRADAPNLYWAIADLPRPIVDLRMMAETERSIVEALPWYGGIDPRKISAEKYAAWLNDPEVGDALGRMMRIATVTPAARAYLLSQGYAQAQIEQMPGAQLAGTYFLETYLSYSDLTLEQFRVPYWQLGQHSHIDLDKKWNEINMGLNPLMRYASAWPGLLLLVAQAERHIAMMQTVEAIRGYAYTNGGRLPASLNELDLYAPADPVTGKEFEYALANNEATLRGPAPNGREKETRIFHIRVSNTAR